MANWQELKRAIAEVIRSNGLQEITGQLMQDALNSIISNLGGNPSYAGIADVKTDPGTPDANVFYIAAKPGTYTYFNGIEVPNGNIGILSNETGNWQLSTILFSAFGVQMQIDNTLTTTSKKIPGAINELNENKADNEDIPTNLSQLKNDEEFIKNTVDNLTNYYLKKDTYTKSEVNALIGKIIPFSIKKLDELPETGDANIIYIIPSINPQGQNIYEEYLWLDGIWEIIGTTRIDLSDYYTIEQVNEKFVEKVTGKGLSTNDYTNSDKEKVTNAQPKTDNNLKTTDKTITGAINEVYSTLGNIGEILDDINGEDA